MNLHASDSAAPRLLRDPSACFQRDLVALIPHLRAFSRTLCGTKASAEDLAQDALAKAWRARDSFEPGTNLKAWLFTILRNEFYSYGRSAWRQTPWDENLAESIPAPARAQEWAMQLSDAARALRELPDAQREALILISAGGFSYDEAAKICGVAAGTVKSRVARGRKALLQKLDGHTPLATRMQMHVTNGTNDIMAQLNALTTHNAAYEARP